MRPLGSHAPPEGDAPSLTVLPSPTYCDFVFPGRPVLFRGVTSCMPAFSRACGRYGSLDYLSGRYGSLKVSVELGKKENRSAGVCSSSLASFLRSFTHEGVYMVESLPAPMHGEV